MGAGTRQAQMKNRFGLGQPVDTYGEPCPHVKAATQVKETIEALSYTDVIDAQSSIFWKQAINEAVQDSNLKALAGVAEDLGDLKSYYENGELSLIIKGTAAGGINIRVTIPPNLTKTMMAEEGPVKVELINPTTGKSYKFYKDFHNVEDPDIDIPTGIMTNFQVGQDVIMKMKQLPIWEFVNRVEGKASEVIKFKGKGGLVVNLSGKEIPIQSFEYDYSKARGIGGAVYIAFQVEDISGSGTKFKLYSNGWDEPSVMVYDGEQFRPIDDIKYDLKRDAVTVKYYHHNRNQTTNLRFREPPAEIDLDNGIATEEMRKRVASGNKIEIGEVGEEIAAKFAEEKLLAKVFPKREHHGPDRPIIYGGEPGILEAKLITYKRHLNVQFEKAIDQVLNRLKGNSEYRCGVAFAVYFDKDTGYFELVHKIITPETQNTAYNKFQGGER